MRLTSNTSVVMFGWELSEDFIKDLPNHVDRWNQAGVKGSKKRKKVR